jgi:hypothetical protein
MKYRVTWIDRETGESCGVSVSTMHTARMMAETLQLARNVKDIVLSAHCPRTLNHAHIEYR